MAKAKSTGLSTFDRFTSVSRKIDTSNLTSGEIAALHELGVDIEQIHPARKGGRPFRFGPEIESLILKLVNGGASIASIAIQFDVCEQTIRNVIARNLEQRHQ